MKKCFVTFSNADYKKARDFNIWTAKHIAKFDACFSLGPEDMDDNFKSKNSKILSYKTGAGLWLWKPWAFKHVLDKIDDGDYLFYTDAACFWVNNIDHIIKKMDQDVWICDNSLIEEQFTKPKLFENLQCDNDLYRKSRQRPAIFLGVRKSKFSCKIIDEWLSNCEQEENMTPFSFRDLDLNDIGFIAHRMDQSVLSLITKKYGIKASLCPSLSGRYPEFERFPNATFMPTVHDFVYPICVIHHRQREVSFLLLLKQLIMLVCPYCFMKIYAKIKMK